VSWWSRCSPLWYCTSASVRRERDLGQRWENAVQCNATIRFNLPVKVLFKSAANKLFSPHVLSLLADLCYFIMIGIHLLGIIFMRSLAGSGIFLLFCVSACFSLSIVALPGLSSFCFGFSFASRFSLLPPAPPPPLLNLEFNKNVLVLLQHLTTISGCAAEVYIFIFIQLYNSCHFFALAWRRVSTHAHTYTLTLTLTCSDCTACPAALLHAQQHTPFPCFT
jgi:hypothetical protein